MLPRSLFDIRYMYIRSAFFRTSYILRGYIRADGETSRYASSKLESRVVNDQASRLELFSLGNLGPSGEKLSIPLLSLILEERFNH